MKEGTGEDQDEEGANDGAFAICLTKVKTHVDIHFD